MKSRRRAREATLQALYQCDTLSEWNEKCADLYFQVFMFNDPARNDGGIDKTTNENYKFARSLITGVLQNLQFLDSQIAAASTNWSVSRMSRVDRNILRFAAFEIGFLNDIPTSVSINEAIEIAKAYGTPDSPMFINGVLDNIASVFDKHRDSAGQLCDVPLKKVAANS